MTTYKEINFTIEQQGAQMVVLLDNEVQFEIALGNGKEYAVAQCKRYINNVLLKREEKTAEQLLLSAINKGKQEEKQAYISDLEKYLKKVNNSKKMVELGLAFEECEDDTHVLSLDGDQAHAIAGVRAFNEMIESAAVFMYENGEKIVMEVIVSYWSGHMNLLDISYDIQDFDLKTKKHFYTILKDILKGLNKNV